MDLRLVAFPGAVELAHPQALKITSRVGKVFLAADIFAAESPAPNVGEYDLKEILLNLPANQSATLTLPLEKEQTLSLSLPAPVILEWQTIANS